MARPPIEGVVKRPERRATAQVIGGRVAWELDEAVKERGLRHIAELREQLARSGRDPRIDAEQEDTHG